MTRACVVAALFLAGCNFKRESAPAVEVPTLELAPPPHFAKPLIEVTPAAANTIRQHAVTYPETKGYYLRVRVVPGSCQGFMHKLDLDMGISGEDHTFVSNGVNVVVAARQIELIRGATVDFGEEKGQVGFKVKNPNFEGESAKRCMEELESNPIAK